MNKPLYLKPHKQVPAKVTAYVDRDIKELIEVLNTIKGVRTSESCQGENGKFAYVCLDYGIPGKTTSIQVCEFVDKLVREFSKCNKAIDLNYHTRFSVIWQGDKDSPYIFLELSPNCIAEVVTVFLEVKKGLADHNKCDTPPSYLPNLEALLYVHELDRCG